MAVSKCARCDNTAFEAKENSPQNSAFKVTFIQCASCGAVVGVQEYFNAGALLDQVQKQQSKVAEAIKRMAISMKVAVDL